MWVGEGGQVAPSVADQLILVGANEREGEEAETSSGCAALVKVRLHSDVIRTRPPSGLADPAVIGLFLTGCPLPVSCCTAPLCTACIALIHTDCFFVFLYLKKSWQQLQTAVC